LLLSVFVARCWLFFVLRGAGVDRNVLKQMLVRYRFRTTPLNRTAGLRLSDDGTEAGGSSEAGASERVGSRAVPIRRRRAERDCGTPGQDTPLA
jgi:hypothetical protein